MNQVFRSATLASAIAMTLLAGSASAQSGVGLDHREAKIARGSAGLPLAAASRARPQAIVAHFLRSHRRGADTLASLHDTGSTPNSHGVTHVRMQQQVD